MIKNTAGQKLTVFAFDSTTNLPKTGDAANITAYESLDDGAVTALADTSATELDATNAKGYYDFDLAQAETNANKILFSAKSSTANIVVVGVPAVVYPNIPQTGDSFARLGAPAGASTAADIAALSTTLAGFAGPGFLAGTLSAVASATSMTFAVGSGTITDQMVASWVGLNLYLNTAGRAPENLPIATATRVDTTHATLTFSPGFQVLPIANDVAYIGGTHG